MEYEHLHSTITSQPENNDKKTIEDYSHILEENHLQYKAVGYHLQVGEITKVQGWILHISVVRWQVVNLLESIIPVLIRFNTPFKVVKNKETTRMLLDGNIDFMQVGKVVSIYPETINDTIILATELIPITGQFKGPLIATDIHLGGNVYTRYGSFNPIIIPDETGKLTKFIYSSTGKLIPDEYNIPFKLPSDIDWPFSTFASPTVKPQDKVLSNTYRILKPLKLDAKGSVYKAFYLKNILKTGYCIIKEGRNNMWSDEADRSMPERLQWQKEVHEDLEGKLPLPKVIDLFYKNGDAYLALEYINGKTLISRIQELNTEYAPWVAMPIKKRTAILTYLRQIINIISILHKSGYVHRDITPVNFLVDKQNKIHLIDNELCFSLHKQKPTPPFQRGTDGFMSPEQINVQQPTISEDVYALGATMIMLLTGFHPLTFANDQQIRLPDRLHFFLGDKSLANVISLCLNSNPKHRPSISFLQEIIDQHLFQSHQHELNKTVDSGDIDKNFIVNIISSSINGLVSAPTLLFDDIWQSKATPNNNSNVRENEIFCPGLGLHDGLLGPLYLLAKAQKHGFDISQCKNSFKKGWIYLQENFLASPTDIPPGLSGGNAGVALALAAGIEGDLIEDNQNIRSLIHSCLSTPAVDLSLNNGIPGQGLALLQCKNYFDNEKFNLLLRNFIETIFTHIKYDKNYLLNAKLNKKGVSAGFSYGNGGLFYFLLEYLRHTNDTAVANFLTPSIANIVKRLDAAQTILKKYGIAKIINDIPLLYDDIKGSILILIQAYEIFENPVFKKNAEDMLLTFPHSIVYNNLSQDLGLSNLGEIYLEAYSKFKDKKWLDRATWILQVILHTSKKNPDGSYHWVNRNSSYITADFLTGTSGIIHFLMKFLAPDQIGYRLLIR